MFASTQASLYAGSAVLFGMVVVGVSYLAITVRPRPKYQARHMAARR